MKKILLATLLVVAFNFATYGQIGLAYGYSSTSAGVGLSFPSLKKEVTSGPWTTFILRNGIFEFSYAESQFTYGESGTDAYQEDKGVIFQAGMVLPLHNLTILQRKSYWKGIHITPLVGLHYTTQTMGRWDGIAAGQSGINLATAILVQFPLGMIDLRLSSSYYFGNDRLKTVMDRYRNANYMFTPSITFQLDGMFEKLGGSIVESGEYTTTWRSLESEEVEYDEYGNFKLKTTRRKYKYNTSSGKSSKKLQKAFWYLAGSFNQVSPRLSQGSPDSNGKKVIIPEGIGFGSSIGGRFRGLMADIALEQTGGFYANRSPGLIDELKGSAEDYPFVEGSFNALEVRGKIGVDAILAVQNVIAKKRILKLNKLTWPWTTFLRYNLGLSGGYAIPSKTNIRTAQGDQLLDQFFANNPDIESNSRTDIRKNRAGYTVGFFMNWEMGPFAVEFDWHGYNGFGWRTGVGLKYMIPMNQLANLRD